MTAEEFINFRAKWVSEDIETDDPDSVVTFKMCYMDFSHAGRWKLRFRNQGFDTNSFGMTSLDDDGNKLSHFYNYITSTDVCYYDAEFETESRPAYDVALYAEAFRNADGIDELSHKLSNMFEALAANDQQEFNLAVSLLNAKIGKDGSIEIDCFDRFGLLFDLKLFPAGIL